MSFPRRSPLASTTERILTAIADPAQSPLPSLAIVVAHPDDETIACGAQLSRAAVLTVIHTTDGAPRTGFPNQFATWQDYAATRRGELVEAMRLAGVGKERLQSLGWADQESAFHLAAMAHALAERIAGHELVVTHAYEGGHPDHDSTAFAVHAACDLLRWKGTVPPIILEAPLYRAGPDGGWQAQSFLPANDAPAATVELSPAEQDLKHRMFAAHASQAEVLGMFRADTEQFRVAPAYDFTALPNGGAVLYDGFGWGITGRRWLELAGAARRDLALERAA